MKLFETSATVNRKGRLRIPEEVPIQLELSPGDEIRVLICGDRKIVISTSDEALDRPDPLDSLPEDLRTLCHDLGFNPDTVRNVMREGGYFRE